MSSPLNVWGDQSDLMAVRDTGWIQMICENGQEAFDTTSVSLPHRGRPQGSVARDGTLRWFLSDSRRRADRIPFAGGSQPFLPPINYPLPLNPDKPLTMGAFAPSFIYTEAKKAQEVNIRDLQESNHGTLG